MGVQRGVLDLLRADPTRWPTLRPDHSR